MNNITLVGRLTKDPVLAQSREGVPHCHFSLAVNRNFKNKEADFFDNVTTWRSTAESCAKYLRKGSMVAVHGRMECNEWTDSNGEKHKMWVVQADEVQFLTRTNSEQKQSEPEPLADEDDLPFD